MHILQGFTLLSFSRSVGLRSTTHFNFFPAPGDTFEVTAEDVCFPGYAKKLRAVLAWLNRQAYAEYGITQYKTGDYGRRDS
jgi:hypothetical protein